MYQKLVRDNIPDIIRNNGEEPIVEVLDDERYKTELERKLLEEANEVINAGGVDRVEELADLLEVMDALVIHEGYTLDDVLEARSSKLEKRGGFSKRLYLSDVKK